MLEKKFDRNKITSVVHIGADYSGEEVFWLRAISNYQQKTGKRVLSARDTIAIAKSLGYRKVSKSSQSTSS